MARPLEVESLDQEGRGVARRDGKTIFIEGALPGERVYASIHRRKPAFEVGTIDRIVEASSARLTPQCRHFGRCGGCALQHMDVPTQVATKQRVMEEALARIGKVRPDVILPATYGTAWQYRHRARLSVRYVPKKGGVLVGFHERRSSYVADMASCEIVPARISTLLLPLRDVIGRLSVRQRLPQVELSIGDQVDVLVLRVLQPLTERDEAILNAFAETHELSVYVQPNGPDSARPLNAETGTDIHYDSPSSPSGCISRRPTSLR